ncbi:MAG: hypothetical protein J6Z01_05795 [Bacteroidales bacterium]|nr:hypothetical protein [Bacteroidales bacterium]
MIQWNVSAQNPPVPPNDSDKASYYNDIASNKTSTRLSILPISRSNTATKPTSRSLPQTISA